MKRRRKRIVLWTLAFLLGLTVFDYWTFPLLTRDPAGHFDKGSNGLWLRYPWYFGQRTTQEIRDLGGRLKQDGFRYAYFHVRDVKPDGTLRYPRFQEARHLNTVLREADPYLRRIAWVYIGNERGRGAVRLSDPAVRKVLIGQGRRLLTEGGFDGIQWDYEICDDGDASLLALLKESRQAFPDQWLGVAVPIWYPWPLSRVGWSEGYFRRVGENCDQIAVMAYDTGVYHPRLYSWLVAQQVAVLGRATEGLACRFVMGVPTYEDGTLSHNPRAENLSLAIRAVRSALAESPPSRFEGLALFADYTTDAREWETFRGGW